MLEPLSQKDYKKIGSLIILSNYIWIKHQRLASLEINGQKETEQYQKILQELSKLNEIEQILYRKMEKSSKLYSIVKYFYSIIRSKNETMLDTIIDGKEIIIKRIIRQIELLISKKKKHKNSSNPNSFEELLASSIESKEGTNSFQNDNYACLLSILKKFIHSSSYPEIKDSLILAKYRLSCMSSNIETMMLKDNFELPSQVYFEQQCIDQLQGQDTWMTSFLRTSYASDMIHEQLAILLVKFSDTTVLEPSSKTEVILRICMLRASFLLLSEQEIFSENELFYNLLENPNYCKKKPNHEVVAMIKNAYQKMKEDREIPIFVSFIK